ncbi:hypothetical protein OUZ56_026522 [Daphnia magna]|uniref:Uncharacterized protein n=1 Tax=Daphnia magna TaxID=35525 RepID=A0ABQ9ZNC5_9CRUS|nr:hypothetical protein OUZ56_026522 [Daphnia magna]
MAYYDTTGFPDRCTNITDAASIESPQKSSLPALSKVVTGHFPGGIKPTPTPSPTPSFPPTPCPYPPFLSTPNPSPIHAVQPVLLPLQKSDIIWNRNV